MNREIKSKKVKGRGRIYLESCPIRESEHTTIKIGSPYCQSCEHFQKIINHKDGRQSVSCIIR